MAKLSQEKTSENTSPSGKNDAGRFGVDELLQQQSEIQLLATIEGLADDKENVKITPWIPNAGCACERALKIPKKAIAWVSPTGSVHHCCGKQLKVVHIEFDPEATLSARETFRDRLALHSDHSHSSVSPRTRQGLSAAGVTCICDHFVRRYCVNGEMYEDYLCYDETGAACGSQTVDRGPCPGEAHANARQMMPRSTRLPLAPQRFPGRDEMSFRSYSQLHNAGYASWSPSSCPPISQCPWGCCPQNSPVACATPHGCACCATLADCYNGLC